MTEKTVSKLQTFIKTGLRRIHPIYWPSTISNFNLWEATGQAPVKRQIMSRKWTWIGHTIRRPMDCIARQAFHWNPQGSRRSGRPRNSWRRNTESTIQMNNCTWTQMERLARDRGYWRSFVSGLCSEME